MISPRVVVIPFGVPDEERGLGLGLAAFVHGFARIDGESVALAQLLARGPEDVHSASIESAPLPVEAFVSPNAWRDLTASGAPPPGVNFVVTGAFEPPVAGRGLLQLLAFDIHDGSEQARVETAVETDTAGRALMTAFDEVFRRLGGELGNVRDLGELPWEPLESVLRAERCALHDPLRGGPHDRVAAMAHLGRAIGDAPDGRFPAARLSTLALELAFERPRDLRLLEAARRAIARALDDAPRNADLLEAHAALSLRLGDAPLAQARATEALELEPERPRSYALLSEARRALGDLDGALAAIEDGLPHGATDPWLSTERGLVLAERGKLDEAERAWRMVLELRPLYPPAYMSLASLLERREDVVGMAQLVDDALRALPSARPEVLRRAVEMLLATEPEGIARAARADALTKALTRK